ncbi:unnamed protein product, partial [Mesorhabditis spiculigera]
MNVLAVLLFYLYSLAQSGEAAGNSVLKPSHVLSLSIPFTNHLRAKRYVLRRKRWTKRALRWKLSKKHITEGDEFVVRNTLHRAFNNWAAVSSAKFEEVSQHEEADIEIGFEKGRHADSFPFDGTDGIVAHAFYPRDGRLHFDADEKWTLNSDDGVNLYQTAVHEIGHLLGLEHSTDPRAAMFAAKRPYDPDFGLADDDVRAIRTLFPVNTNNNVAAKHSRIVVPPRPISTYEINSELEHMRFIPTTTPSRINYEYEFQTTTRKPEWPIKTRKQELPFNFDPILWPGYFEAKR